MLIRKILTIIFCVISFSSFAQDPLNVLNIPSAIFRTINRDSFYAKQWQWERGGSFSFNLAQGSLKNWAAGGDNFSLTVNSYFNYFIFYKKGKSTWDNTLDFNFGYLKTTSLGSQKNDDRFDIFSKYGYQIDTSKKLYVSFLGDFRTQFFDGYTYAGDSATFTSTFLSPAYLLLSAGLDYHPFKNFSAFVSPLTGRLTILASDRLYTKDLYGVSPYSHSFYQMGAYASFNYYSPDVVKNVSYRGRLDLFSDYHNKPENLNVYMTNYFTFKVNKFLSATYDLDFIYDDNAKLFGPNHNSPALQIRSMLGIGLMLPLKRKIS